MPFTCVQVVVLITSYVSFYARAQSCNLTIYMYMYIYAVLERLARETWPGSRKCGVLCATDQVLHIEEVYTAHIAVSDAGGGGFLQEITVSRLELFQR